MEVYRLSKTEYAEDVMGTGAKLFGGRWNKINIPCIYTASSRALAILEFSVNVNVRFFPLQLSLVTFNIDEQYIETIPAAALPKNWKESPAPITTQNLGSKYLEGGAAIIRVPSTVVDQEYNYIINPLFEKKVFSIEEIRNYPYDERIKR